MSVQLTLTNLSDLGIAGTLLSLINRNIDDKILVGNYISSIRYYKNILMISSYVIGGFIVSFYNVKQNWQLDLWFIFASVMLSIYAQNNISYYAPILQAKKDLKNYYKPQIISNLVRLIIGYLLFTYNIINALQATLLLAMSLLYNSIYIYNKSKNYFTLHDQKDNNYNRQVLTVILPIIPLVLFNSLQNQITTFLIGYFGKAKDIAGLGALTRIGQLFAILMPFNTVIIMPLFAKISDEKISRSFFIVLCILLLVISPMVFIAYMYPDLIIILLGSRFSLVKGEIGLYVFSASLNFLSNAIWSIQVVRKWTSWYFGLYYVISTVLIQYYLVQVLDLSVLYNVVLFGFITALNAVMYNILASTISMYKTRSQRSHLV